MQKLVHAGALIGATLVCLVGGVPVALAQGSAQINGKVVDSTGDPVREFTLRFTRQEDDASREVTTRKNGSFSPRGLVPGKYVVQAVDARRFVSTLEFEMKNTHGLRTGHGRMDGHPKNGAGPFPYNGRDELTLRLVVSDRSSEDAQGLARAFAAPELNEAVKLYDRGKFEKVVDVTAALVASDPDLGEAHYMRGIALQRLERHDEAARSLDLAAQKMPDQPGVWSALGRSALLLADQQSEAGDAGTAHASYERAVEVLTRAQAQEPDSAAVLLGLGRALDRIDAHDRLAAVLEQMLEIEPGNVPAKLRLASLYAERGDQAPALALLESLGDQEKKAAVTFYNVAVQLNDAGNVDGALAAAVRATEIDPGLYQPHQLVAQIRIGRGEHEAAAESVRRFLELAPDHAEAETYRRILSQLESP